MLFPTLFAPFSKAPVAFLEAPETPFTAPSTAVPIVFNTNGKTQALTTLGGTAVTSAQLNKEGIYLAYYENNTLQLLTGI